MSSGVVSCVCVCVCVLFQTVVLGYFDFELDPEPREYLAYLGAARLALADGQYEYAPTLLFRIQIMCIDIGDGLRFGVISSVKVALVAEMPHHPSIMLCRSTRPDKVSATRATTLSLTSNHNFHLL